MRTQCNASLICTLQMSREHVVTSGFDPLRERVEQETTTHGGGCRVAVMRQGAPLVLHVRVCSMLISLLSGDVLFDYWHGE